MLDTRVTELDRPLSAADLQRHRNLDEPARELFRPGMTSGQYLDTLLKAEQYAAACWFWAGVLSRREAVWWGCRCLKEISAQLGEEEIAAMRVAERWVENATEESRRACGVAAEKAGTGTPVGCVTLGGFWSGGSIAPEGLPVVPPAEHLTAHAVAGAVMLCVVREEPEKAPDRFREAFRIGRAVAKGQDSWPKTAATEPGGASAGAGGSRISSSGPVGRTSGRGRDRWEQ